MTEKKRKFTELAEKLSETDTTLSEEYLAMLLLSSPWRREMYFLIKIIISKSNYSKWVNGARQT